MTSRPRRHLVPTRLPLIWPASRPQWSLASSCIPSTVDFPLGFRRPDHAFGPAFLVLEEKVSAVTSAGDRLAGDEIVEGGLCRIASGGHHLEDRPAVADLLLHGEHRALRRGFLDDSR